MHTPQSTGRTARRSLRALIAALACALLLAGCVGSRAPSRPERSEPTLVFIHGLGGGPADWTEVANALGREHRVLLVSLPGHGHHAMVDSLPLAAAASDVVRRLRTIEGPVVLVGHSVGGAVAVRAALADPAQVAGLVLVETALKPQLPEEERDDVAKAFAADFPYAIQHVYGGFASGARQADELERQAVAVGPAAFGVWLRDVLGDDLTSRATLLRVPVLVVLADRSWPVAEPWPATAESLGYARMPRVTPVRIEGCGHFVMLDRPVQLEDAIRAWLPGVSLSAPRRAGA
jgi:pimeloyl-ACP methyl ester carboxylesterase